MRAIEFVKRGGLETIHEHLSAQQNHIANKARAELEKEQAESKAAQAAAEKEQVPPSQSTAFHCYCFLCADCGD